MIDSYSKVTELTTRKAPVEEQIQRAFDTYIAVYR